MRGWEAHVRRVFDRAVLQRWIPADGDVVELGTARAINFNYLCGLFGPDRCRGYDLINDTEHPRIRIADVRELGPEHDGPIALGWNDLSDWTQSPASKRAGQAFILRNLVRGGLYVDAGLPPGEPAPRVRDCELDAVAGGLLIYRRERGGPPYRSRGPVGPLSPAPAWWQWLDRVLRVDPRPVWTRASPGLCWSPVAAQAALTPEACAEAFMRGAAELLGRLRVRAQGRWAGARLEAGPLLSFVFAGDGPLELVARGSGETRALRIERGAVLVVPPRWALARREPALERQPWLVRAEHHSPAWVSLAPTVPEPARKKSSG